MFVIISEELTFLEASLLLIKNMPLLFCPQTGQIKDDFSLTLLMSAANPNKKVAFQIFKERNKAIYVMKSWNGSRKKGIYH